MERILWLILLNTIGEALCNPYYYRESKQHSEHHKEYSSQSSLPPSHVDGQEGMSGLQFSSKPTPERYYSVVSPMQTGSYQSQAGGYSFSHGSLQQGSLYQSPLTVSRLTVQPVFQAPPAGGSVAVRKFVQVYTYPSSSQSGYVHYSQSRSGSGIVGHNQELDSMFGTKEVNGKHDETLYGKYFPIDRSQNSQTVHIRKVITSQHSGFGQRGDHVGDSLESSEDSQKEQLEELGQRPETEELGQKEESLYHSSRGHLELGQEEEPLSPGQHSEEAGQREESLYPSSHGERLELGQHEEPLNGQPLEVLGQKEESLYQSSYSGRQGQQEESLSGHHSEVIGHKEKSLYHSSYGDLEVGQEDERLVDKKPEETGQKETSLYQSSPFGSLEVGQKEESFSNHHSEDLGQKEEHLGHSSNVGRLELGQQEEPSSGFHSEVNGQREKSLYQSSPVGSLEVGQKEESFNNHHSEDLGQKEEHLDHSTNVGRLELGQQEEPLSGLHSVVNGQRAESRYPNSPVGSLEVGQKEESFSNHHSEDLGQKEEHLDHSSNVGRLELGQQEEPLSGLHSVVNGQRTESRYPNSPVGSLEVGQKEESFSNHHSEDLGQKEEHLDHSSNVGRLELGQQEEPLSGLHSEANGQRAESHTYYPRQNLGLGKQEEISTIEIGQREEPVQMPVRKQYSQSTFQKEINVHHTSIPSGSLALGHRPSWEPVQATPPGRQEIGQVQNSQISGLVSGHQNGFSSQKGYLCEHSQNHMHGGFGTGQRGHNLQISQVGGTTQGNNHRNEDVGRRFLDANGQEDGKTIFGQHDMNYNVRRINQTLQRSTTEYNRRVGIESNSPSSTNIPSQLSRGTEMNLNKKIDDLVLELGLGKSITNPGDELTPKETFRSEETSARTTTSQVHTAEIQELGLEDFNKQGSSEFRVLEGTPERRVNIFQTHKEEVGLNYPPTRRAYSKKHSRQYSVTTNVDYDGIEPRKMEAYSLHSQSPSSGQHSGGSYSYSQHGYSASQGGSYVNDQPVQRQQVSKTEFFGGSQQGNREAVIHEFLSELDKDIARSGGKRTQSGFVQVTSQQQPPNTGSSFYSQQSYSSHSSHSSSSSGSSSGSGDRSWFQKVGDSIGSTYNKAADKIGTSYAQARDKAKEIVESVKQKVSYY